MKELDNHNKEWFQVTVTFGNFYTAEEAKGTAKELSYREDFIAGEVKGSWH